MVMLHFSFQYAKVVNTVNYQMFYLSLHYKFLVEFNDNYMLYLGEPFTVHSSNCILIMPVKDLTSTSHCSKPNVVTAPTKFHNQRTFRSFYRVNLFIFEYKFPKSFHKNPYRVQCFVFIFQTFLLHNATVLLSKQSWHMPICFIIFHVKY